MGSPASAKRQRDHPGHRPIPFDDRHLRPQAPLRHFATTKSYNFSRIGVRRSVDHCWRWHDREPWLTVQVSSFGAGSGRIAGSRQPPSVVATLSITARPPRATDAAGFSPSGLQPCRLATRRPGRPPLQSIRLRFSLPHPPLLSPTPALKYSVMIPNFRIPIFRRESGARSGC
jgi:hypothetical protein